MTESGARRGLGRGLSALLGDISEPRVGAAPQELGVSALRPNPDQPRRSFDEQELEDLANSIRIRGVLQPILVRPAPGLEGVFQIVAGERRWRAAQKAGLATVPVLVRSLDDAVVAEISIVENIQRADLTPIEEALGYKSLIERFSHTQETVARAVGKSRSYIANTLRLLNLPEVIQAQLAQGQLSAGHARAIAATPDPARLAEAIIAGGLTVRQAEELARDASGASSPSKTRQPAHSSQHDGDIHALEYDLRESTGFDVKIIDRNGKGEVRVSYRSLDQLDNLCRKLTAS